MRDVKCLIDWLSRLGKGSHNIESLKQRLKEPCMEDSHEFSKQRIPGCLQAPNPNPLYSTWSTYHALDTCIMKCFSYINTLCLQFAQSIRPFGHALTFSCRCCFNYALIISICSFYSALLAISWYFAVVQTRDYLHTSPDHSIIISEAILEEVIQEHHRHARERSNRCSPMCVAYI